MSIIKYLARKPLKKPTFEGVGKFRLLPDGQKFSDTPLSKPANKRKKVNSSECADSSNLVRERKTRKYKPEVNYNRSNEIRFFFKERFVVHQILTVNVLQKLTEISFTINDVLNTAVAKAAEIFAIPLLKLSVFNEIYTELEVYCKAYLKNPYLKLPRIMPTAPQKEDSDSVYIGTLNAQGFSSKERLTVYAEDFRSLGLSLVGVTEVKKRNEDYSVLTKWAAINNFKLFTTKHVAILSLDSRFTWHEEPVVDLDERKATAKVFFNNHYLFDFCVEYQPASSDKNIHYNKMNSTRFTASKTCSVSDRNAVANIANDTIGQKSSGRATTKSYINCMAQRKLEDLLQDGTQTEEDMTCFIFPRTEADSNPSSRLDTVSTTLRLKDYFLRPFTRWCRRSDHKIVVVELKIKKFISELTPTSSADTSAASLEL